MTALVVDQHNEVKSKNSKKTFYSSLLKKPRETLRKISEDF